MPQTHYHAGYNMPGYLPEMDPFTTASTDSAKRFMISELDRSGDIAFDSDEKDLADELSGHMEDLNLTNVQDGWDLYAGDLHYWINACTNATCEADDE